MSFRVKIFPGVRVRIGARGVRVGVGPRIARAHVGTRSVGVSTGVGPLGAYATVLGGKKRRRAPRRRSTASSRKSSGRLTGANSTIPQWRIPRTPPGRYYPPGTAIPASGDFGPEFRGRSHPSGTTSVGSFPRAPARANRSSAPGRRSGRAQAAPPAQPGGHVVTRHPLGLVILRAVLGMITWLVAIAVINGTLLHDQPAHGAGAALLGLVTLAGPALAIGWGVAVFRRRYRASRSGDTAL